MNEETKQLIDDAAKLLGLEHARNVHTGRKSPHDFNPLDPERGDLMKVADAAGLMLDFEDGFVVFGREIELPPISFTKGDHQSLALAVLRAASVVWKARNGNET